jgi:Xaa-Pro aminopeptidase
VHDVGDYVRDGRARVLEPGMVFTVEPGLYVPVDWADGPTELRGTGVRIEDDVLITPGGHEVLTGGLPADVDGIEALLD